MVSLKDLEKALLKVHMQPETQRKSSNHEKHSGLISLVEQIMQSAPKMHLVFTRLVANASDELEAKIHLGQQI